MFLFTDLAQHLASFDASERLIWRRLIVMIAILVRFDVMAEDQGRAYIEMSFDAVDASTVEHLLNHYSEFEDDVRAFLATN